MACLFCGAAGPLTDEHAVPAWARKAIGAYGKTTLHMIPPGGRPSSLGTSKPLRTYGGLTVKARKALCESCNTGWLRLMEDAAGPILGPAMRCEPITLADDQRALIGYWATAKALLIDEAYRQTRGGVPPPSSHLRWLNDHRDAREPPPGTHIWIAGMNAMSGNDFVPSWASSGQIRHSDPGIDPDTADTSYVAAFSVGCLVIQVIGQDFRESDHRSPSGLPLARIIPFRKIAPYLIPIWPEGDPVTVWPPDHILQARDWPAFAEWFEPIRRFYRVETGTERIVEVFMAENVGSLP